MATTATTPEQPAAALEFKSQDSYILTTDCTIEMICHDRQFRDTVFVDNSGTTLFALDSPALFTSWHVRRSLRDAAGLQVLQIRHAGNTLLEHWYIEDARGKQLCEVRGSKAPKSGATVIEGTVLAGDGEEVAVDVRSGDHAGSETIFRVGEEVAAEMTLVKNNDLSFLGRRGLDRSGWRLKVVAGADLAMVAALAVCRAEVLHVYRR
jgi:uncharacterized protein YxjI